jgi:hypothetical protein
MPRSISCPALGDCELPAAPPWSGPAEGETQRRPRGLTNLAPLLEDPPPTVVSAKGSRDGLCGICRAFGGVAALPRRPTPGLQGRRGSCNDREQASSGGPQPDLDGRGRSPERIPGDRSAGPGGGVSPPPLRPAPVARSTASPRTPASTHRVEVIGGVFAEQSTALLRRFLQSRRGRPQAAKPRARLAPCPSSA